MNFTKRLMVGAALAWLLTSLGCMSDTANSQPSSDTAGAAVLGPGWAECAEVNGDVSGDGNLRSLFTSWLQGYISGMNEAGQQRDTGADASPYALIAAALDTAPTTRGIDSPTPPGTSTIGWSRTPATSSEPSPSLGT